MRRRDFLKLTGAAVVGVAAGGVVFDPRHGVSFYSREQPPFITYLSQLWNAHVKGKPHAAWSPLTVYLGPSEWAAFESEIHPVFRFTDTDDARRGVRSLCFKAGRVLEMEQPGICFVGPWRALEHAAAYARYYHYTWRGRTVLVPAAISRSTIAQNTPEQLQTLYSVIDDNAIWSAHDLWTQEHAPGKWREWVRRRRAAA